MDELFSLTAAIDVMSKRPILKRTSILFFFFHAEDGIRYHCVTGVQTCALPICGLCPRGRGRLPEGDRRLPSCPCRGGAGGLLLRGAPRGPWSRPGTRRAKGRCDRHLSAHPDRKSVV